MLALTRLARLGARNIVLPRIVPTQTLVVQRLNHDDKKKVLEQLKDFEKHQGSDQHTWESWGFDHDIEALDRHKAHIAFFGTVTLILVTGSVFWAYGPDTNLRHWAQREAFLQLRYREEHGLPLIDPNFINPEKIVLPSDEELGDTEIII